MPNSEFRARILVETDDIIAWNKPPKLATTGRDLDDPNCAQFRAIQYVDDMVWALHQLDQDTSGVLLFAKKKNLVATWQQKWHTEPFQKYYVALVHGQLSTSPLTVDAALVRRNRPGYTQVEVDTSGKSATTRIWNLSQAKNYSLVLAQPLTGRTHQVRVHLQHIGCPLVGEKRYNAIPCGHHDRHALHALAIRTDEPAPLDHIEAPLAGDLHKPATRLGLDLSPLEDWMKSLPL